ncbi:MAG: penicillin-insensitive murein endopeptidase [Planctomycetes bacterium]|nr:penicillin-insensitive murein endopeptidase [Planctomycetota bacterium]
MQKKLGFVAALTLALSSFMLAPAPASARGGDAVQVVADVQVMSARGGGQVLGSARAGQVYAVVERDGGWVLVQFSERRGWVAAERVRGIERGVQTVTASALNVRAGPSTRYRAIGQLPNGAHVTAVGSEGAWRKVFFRGQEAWVHGDYLRAVAARPDAPAPAATPARSRAGFVQLPASGPGFYSYAAASRRWGRPELVYALERAGLNLRARPRFGVGDLSLENGGRLSGHTSHRVGRDVDVRPMRRDGREGPVTRQQSAYSRQLTRDLIRELRKHARTDIVLFNDLLVGGVVPWPGHDNHFHFRVR